MSSPTSDSSEPSMHQGNLVTLTKESELDNLGSPKSSIREITDDNISSSEATGSSSSSETGTGTADEAELKNALNNTEIDSPKKNEDIIKEMTPKSSIREITDDNINSTEATGSSSFETLKRTADEAGLNSAPSNTEVDILKKRKDFEEETKLSSLIDNALQVLMEKKSLQDDDISNGVHVIRVSFHYHEGNQFSDVDFKKPENICAFLYRYGPCAAGLTRFRTLQALNNCSTLLHRLKAFSSINIISLGSGPGCDIIGLCSALYEHVRYQRVKLTLVDSVKGWLQAFNIIKLLTREGEFGNVSRFFKDSDVSTTFLSADLSDETEDEVYSSALKEADVILINKLFSILNYDQKVKIEETVVETMKVGAVLLFIDAPDYDFKNLERIYRNSPPEDYCFEGHTFKRFFPFIGKSSKAQISVYTKNSSK